MTPAEAFIAAVRHHQAGRLAEAERLYGAVLAAEPTHALHLRGALAHAAGRHHEAVDLIGRALAHEEQPDFHHNIGLALSALGRRREAADHWARAVAINPDHAAARLNLGNTLREEGRFEEAIVQHRAAAQLWPQSAPVHNSLGLSLARAERHGEAIVHYDHAIRLQPGFIEPCLNLALAFRALGRTDQALNVTLHSFGIRETAESREMFVRLVTELPIGADNTVLRGFMLRALAEGWTAAALLAPACIALIRHGPAGALIARAVEAWPARPEFFASDLEQVSDPLLQVLMTLTVVCNADLEKFLTACRFALLQATDTALDPLLGFACALAHQCHNNEYVYATVGDEEERARRLRDRLEATLAGGADVPPLCVAVVGSYCPLHEISGADVLLARPWPDPVNALLTRQVREPREEAALRDTLAQLTPIEDATSQAVRAQYEVNPYPRWVGTAAPQRFASVEALLREVLPAAPVRPSARPGTPDILIAGCGTGQHAIMTARQYGARVLAIDLSRASLAYAAARTCALGLDIEYAQADIMRLGILGRTFDLIESNGVLHHMADPWAGWRVLLSLLRPGGFMRVGLYSETARWGVVAARALIAQAGYGTNPAEIRHFRHDLMRREKTQGGDDMARNVMWFNDFYSTSECRDLLFHVQEHRMTIPEICAFLRAQDLQFLGFEVDRDTARRYAAHAPSDKAMTDLDRWHAFERDNPHTFANMYRFWMQKAG
jgi:SAM-dependent methyltransferase/Flp pilus assembly protein TadD